MRSGKSNQEGNLLTNKYPRTAVDSNQKGGGSHQVPVVEGDGLRARHSVRQHGRQVLSSKAS